MILWSPCELVCVLYLFFFHFFLTLATFCRFDMVFYSFRMLISPALSLEECVSACVFGSKQRYARLCSWLPCLLCHCPGWQQHQVLFLCLQFIDVSDYELIWVQWIELRECSNNSNKIIIILNKFYLLEQCFKFLF